jgi:hypothetical protein
MNSHRMNALIRSLQGMANRIDPSTNRPEILEAAGVELDALELHAKNMFEALQPKTDRVLQGRELWESLAIAVVGLARARRSARLNAADLHSLVELHAPGYDVPFWASQRAGTAVGLLRFEGWEKIVENGVRKVSDLRKLVETQGVEFWDNWQDEAFRIVDSRWLDSHEDIYTWLTDPWAGGRRCRFCAMVENPMVDELHPLEMTRRNGVTKVGDTVVLPISAALLHDRCRPHFVDWLAIRAKYSSIEEAAAADKVAGRTSRYEKVMQAAALETLNE